MRHLLALLLLLLCFTSTSRSAPISAKEIELLVRQRIPEAEILADTRTRRLLRPLDDAAFAQIKAAGASETLLNALRSPALVLDAQAAHSELQRQQLRREQAAQAEAIDRAAQAARLQRDHAMASAHISNAKIRTLLQDNLYRYTDGKLLPCEKDALEKVDTFLFYYSASWCGPCRRATPKIIEAYNALRQRYPGRIELIMVSADRDEFNMLQYLKNYAMSWPVFRLGQQPEEINALAGKSIPWLLAVRADGTPITPNVGPNAAYLDPGAALARLIQHLESGSPH